MTAIAQRLPRLVAAALAITALVLVAGAALIWGAGGFLELPTSLASGALAVSAGMFAAVCYVGSGWLLASRLPGNPVGWLLLTMGLVFAVMTPTALLVDAAHRAFRPAPPPTLAAAWLLSTLSGPFLVGAGIAAGLLFPDGRLASPRWRWAMALPIVGATLLAVASAIRPGGLIWYPSLPNPFAAPSASMPILSLATTMSTLLLVAGAAAMVLSLVSRYRHGDGTIRAQLRWIMYTGTALAAVLVPFLMLRFVVAVREELGELVVALADVTLAFLPIAAAVAITRYRLFGIDFIIGRTLVYVPMMAILGGLYTASIGLSQRIFVAMTGETSDAPLVIATFTVATAFIPVRKALEGGVDRWTRASSSVGEPDPSSPEMTPEIADVAAGVVALRRLEARVAAGGELASSGPRSRLAIDAEGRVTCPAGGTPQFLACLGCAHLDALVTAPPMIFCARPGSPTRDAAQGNSPVVP